MRFSKYKYDIIHHSCITVEEFKNKLNKKAKKGWRVVGESGGYIILEKENGVIEYNLEEKNN